MATSESAAAAGGGTVGSRILRASLVITGIVFICKILGAVEKFLLPFIYRDDKNALFQMDLYLALAVLAILFYDILRYSVIPALLPAMAKLQEERGEGAALELASSFANALALLFLPVLLLGLLFPEGLVGLFIHPEVLKAGATASDLAAVQAQYLRELELGRTVLRIMVPAGFFLVLGGVCYCVLHNQRRFGVSALGDLAYKLCSIVPLALVCVLVLGWGAREWALSQGIYYISLGVLAGACGLLAIQLVALRASRGHYRLGIRHQDAAFREVLSAAAWPLLYAVIFVGARRILDIYFGFGFGYEYHDRAYYTGLELSYRLVEFPFRFLVEPLAYAIFPFLVAQRTAGDWEGFSRTLNQGLRSVLLILLPMSALLFLVRDPLVNLLWPALGDKVALPLGFYALGILGFGLELLLTRAVFAVGDKRSPALLEILALALYLGTVLFLRESTLRHASVAIGFAASRTGKALCMAAVLAYHRRGLLGGQGWGSFLSRAGLSCGLGAVGAVLLGGRVQGLKAGRVGAIIELAVPSACCLAVYLGGLWVLRVPEFGLLLRKLRLIKDPAPEGLPGKA